MRTGGTERPLVEPAFMAPTVPSAPTAVKATANRGLVRVTWQPGSDGGSAILGYDVYTGTASGAEKSVPSNGATLVTGDSYRVEGLAVGRPYYFTVVAVDAIGASATSNEVAACAVTGVPLGSGTPDSGGGDGRHPRRQGLLARQLLRLGLRARLRRTTTGRPREFELSAPIDQIVSTPDGKGYWLVGSDGGIFAFGDAHFYGSMSSKELNAIIVGMAPTADGKGYWLVGSDGGIFAFGDAGYFGSMGGKPLGHPVVAIAADTQSGGYWEVSSDGTVYPFNAASFGSVAGKPLSQPVVGLVAAPGGRRLLGGVRRRRHLRLRRRRIPRVDGRGGARRPDRRHGGRPGERGVCSSGGTVGSSPSGLPSTEPAERSAAAPGQIRFHASAEDLAEGRGDELELLFAADERRCQLHDRVAAVVGAADQTGLVERLRTESRAAAARTLRRRRSRGCPCP